MSQADNNSANNRINHLWERAALGLLSFIVACLFLVYQGQRDDMKEMQAQIANLNLQKVSKEDLRETEQRINTKMDAMATNLVAISAANKVDILQRLDLLFGTVKGRN